MKCKLKSVVASQVVCSFSGVIDIYSIDLLIGKEMYIYKVRVFISK